MYARLLNLACNRCWQYCNGLMINENEIILNEAYFCQFLSLVILLLVFPSNFIDSGVKGLRYYPVYLLDVILSFILFMYVIIERLSVTASCFLRYI